MLLAQEAPKARNMTARGKREARRPWFVESLSELHGPLLFTQGRRAPLRFALAPWLLYSAPLALQTLTTVRGKFECGHLVIVADEEDVAD